MLLAGGVRKQAFTLIELLIVVAIIAILAAIAVPNFLEAQVRAKVSRAKTDMRSVATALESYAVDNNKYPFTKDFPDPDGYGQTRTFAFLTVPDVLTSPIGYMTSHVQDVFKVGKSADAGANVGRPYQSGDSQDMTFMYLAMRQAGPGPGDPGLGFGFFTTAASWEGAYRNIGEWRLASIGPANKYPTSPLTSNEPAVTGQQPVMSPLSIYDPTNGTVSFGLVTRSQTDPDGKNMKR